MDENDFLNFLALSSFFFQEQLFKWPDSIEIQLLTIYLVPRGHYKQVKMLWDTFCKLRRDHIFLRGLSKCIMFCSGL